MQPLREARDWSPDMDAVARRRDRDCFMRIYDHFMPRVCLYLRGLGTPDAVAEELAQDALLKLWLRAHLYDAARSSLSTWLFRIARNLYIDRVRREPGWMQAQDAVARHHAWLRHFWEPVAESYRGLGKTYAEHPEFRAYYGKYAPGLADWMCRAMDRYAETLPGGGAAPG